MEPVLVAEQPGLRALKSAAPLKRAHRGGMHLRAGRLRALKSAAPLKQLLLGLDEDVGIRLRALKSAAPLKQFAFEPPAQHTKLVSAPSKARPR